MKRLYFKKRNGITMTVLVVTIIIMTIIIGGATTLVGNQVSNKKIADLETAMMWYKNEIDAYYLLNGELPVKEMTFDERTFTNEFRSSYNQAINQMNTNNNGGYIRRKRWK